MTKIFESPDGGNTVYAREASAPDSEKIMIGQNYLAKELIDQRMWTDIYKHRNQNITLQQAVDHVIMIYNISKEYKDGI